MAQPLSAALTLLGEGAASPLGGLLPMILMIAVVYFLLLRPMSKQEKDRKKRMDIIKKGDKVVLNGGLLGRVSNLDEQVAVVELADKIKVRVLRKEIQDLQENVLKKDGDKDKKDDKDKKGKKDKKDKKDKDEGKGASA
jgi:preprotein translocase subunit YajC